MNKKTIRDIAVKGKKVLLRVDFNVPITDSGEITDDTRIRASLPTIKYLIGQNATVIVCSHLGRPDGKIVESMRMRPVARRLSELLGKQVACAADCIGAEVEQEISRMRSGDILMLENLRFHPEEEKNSPEFAAALAKPAEVFVNDAFGTMHRAHASTTGVTKYLPAVAGFLVEKELNYMGKALEKPERPFVAIVGGAKISDKIALFENILGKVDSLLIGGGMANTFLKAKGLEVGSSLVENDKLELANNIIKETSSNRVKLLLPSDVMVASALDEKSEQKIVPVTAVPAKWFIVDIGPGTIELFRAELGSSKTVIWNGPMGMYEMPRFASGTRAVAQILSRIKATTIVGGGSTAEAVQEMGLTGKMTHVSTGGGASLNFLAGKVLPGVAALLDK